MSNRLTIEHKIYQPGVKNHINSQIRIFNGGNVTFDWLCFSMVGIYEGVTLQNIMDPVCDKMKPVYA